MENTKSKHPLIVPKLEAKQEKYENVVCSTSMFSTKRTPFWEFILVGILPIDRKEVYCLKKLFGCYLLTQFPRDDMPHIMDEVLGEAAKVACEEVNCLI